MQQTIRNLILLAVVALYVLPAVGAKDGIFSTPYCLHFLNQESHVWDQAKLSAGQTGLDEAAATEIANRVVRVAYMEMRADLRLMEESLSKTLLSYFRGQRYFEPSYQNQRQKQYEQARTMMLTQPTSINALTVMVPSQAPFFSDILANSPPMSEEGTRQLELILSLRTALARAHANFSKLFVSDATPHVTAKQLEPVQMGLLNSMANEQAAVQLMRSLRPSARNLLGSEVGDHFVTTVAARLNGFEDPSVERLWASHQQHAALITADVVPETVKEELKWESRFERKYSLAFNPLRAYLLQAYCDYFDIHIIYERDEARVP